VYLDKALWYEGGVKESAVVWYELRVGDLGPCTELVYTENDFSWMAWDDDPANDGRHDFNRTHEAKVGYVAFLDREGSTWLRTSGLASGLFKKDPGWRRSENPKAPHGLIMGKPTIKRVPSCSASATS
jgi:hypothetical protein